MKKKSISKFLGTFWRQLLIYGLVVLFIGSVLFYRLGTLLPGFSLPELAARADANALGKLIDNPLFLPHKLLQYGFIRLGHSGAFWMRAVSALWGLAIVLAFFDIIKGWYSRRIAVMSSFLLLSSAWFLHFARLGTPNIMFAITIGLLWVGVQFKSVNAPRVRTILASILILGISLYIPGLAWLVIPMVIWQRKLLISEFSKIPPLLTVLTSLAIIVGLAPLVYSFTKNPSLMLDWLMIPARFEPRVFLSNAWHIPIWLLFRGPTMPVYWLGRVPMFDSFSIVMGILGVFVLNYYRLLDRVKAIVAILLLAFVLTIANGWLALVVALPLFYIVIGAGIALFLQQWFTVFPRNPLARTVGISLVAFVIILAGYYNLQHYFVAWPRSPETSQVFNLL